MTGTDHFEGAVTRALAAADDDGGDPDLTCRAEAICGLAALGHPGLAAKIAVELGSAPEEADSYGLGRLRDARELLRGP